MAMKALSKATIYQVAQAAGVSIATVSRALRDSELVARPTRERVLAAAAELRFTPSRPARSLAEGRHAANGIVFPDLVGPYYAEVVLGYEAAAAALGSSVLILATNGRADASAAVRELAGRVDGMTILGRTVGDDVVAGLAASGLPVVLLARDPVAGVDTVRAENARTAQALAGHLVGHGHRRFVFLGDPDDAPDVAGRYGGVQKGLAAHGAAPAELVRLRGFDLEEGLRAGRRLVGRGQAIICANDEIALGVLLAAEAAGARVPEDVAVTGWDDLLAARFAGLTTVRQPMRELGATAARWLHQRINTPPREKATAETTDGEGPETRDRTRTQTGGRTEAGAGDSEKGDSERRTPQTTDRKTAQTSARAGGQPRRARRRILPTQLVVRHSCGTHSPEVHP